MEDLEPEDAPTQVIPQIPHTVSEQVLIDESGPVGEPEPVRESPVSAPETSAPITVSPSPAPVIPTPVPTAAPGTDSVMSGDTKRIPSHP